MGVKVRVSGIVQGVGFRPYVYTLARELGLVGSVRNDAQGVEIILEGAMIETFLARFETELPPLSRIDTLHVTPCKTRNLHTFEIVASDASGGKNAPVSPDIALCDNCRAELQDPADRRYGYALINCTDCGPRYSITATVPYDRPNTSMARFEMCSKCAAEYADPRNRRYHAQPISCHECGPQLEYIEGALHVKASVAAIDAAADALKKGKIIALKGLGGFHLMCDATSEAAVQMLRSRKRRPTKPLAVMFATLPQLHRYADISDAEAALIDSKEKPIVLVRKNAPCTLAPSITPGIDRLGVFLAYTPLHVMLFARLEIPLVATSANHSDAPILRTLDELQSDLGGVVDGILTHERDIVNAVDDSVVQMLDRRPLVLRLARGFAPLTLPLPRRVSKTVLAVGAQQKNAIALAFGSTLVLSPHIGDLGSIEAFEYFERTVATFKRFYEIEPELIVHDLHPHYDTTRWAHAQGVATLGVQHHHAHIASVMFERSLEGVVLGFAFDGTGYGADGTIWGGEVLRCENGTYERLYHLRPFRLPGGDRVAREPRRSALGLLLEYFTHEEIRAFGLGGFSDSELEALFRSCENGVNSPYCSSMGRLFDAVASLAGLCDSVSYEGESGLMLEASASLKDVQPFAFYLDAGMIDFEPMLREILATRPDAKTVASRFIVTLGALMVQIAKQESLPVVLSGGVFQNITLLEQVTQAFEKEGIVWYLPERVSVNDGGLALGQIALALRQ